MVLSHKVIGGYTAIQAASHLYDPMKRSTPEQMDTYLRDVRYPFIDKSQTKEEQDRELADCVLADAIDAGILVRSFDGPHTYQDFDGNDVLLHRDLPDTTRLRLAVVGERERRMTSKVLDPEHVDMDAEPMIRVMQAAWRICQISTIEEDGTLKTRKNDGRPFSFHPLEAAAILHQAMQRAGELGIRIPDHEMIAILATCLVHDSVEDWVKKDNHYKLDSDVEVVSPRVIKRSMRESGLRRDFLDTYVANAARQMTHEKGQPWMQTYEEYIEELVSNFLAAIVKPAGDNYHNYQIDRLPAPLDEAKLRKYEKKQAILAKNIFGNGVIDARNKKNAYHHDRRAVAYGKPILDVVRGMVEREGDRERYPHVDWSNAVPLDDFRTRDLPEWVDELRERFELSMPITQAA